LLLRVYTSETVEEYGAKMSELSRRIVKAVLMSMRGDFAKKFYESDFKSCQLIHENKQLFIIISVEGKEVEARRAWNEH